MCLTSVISFSRKTMKKRVLQPVVRLMAFRVRIIHLIFLGVIGMCLVLYSSYFATSTQYGLPVLQNSGTDGTVAAHLQNEIQPAPPQNQEPSLPSKNPPKQGEGKAEVGAVASVDKQKLNQEEPSAEVAVAVLAKANTSTSLPATPSPPHNKLVSMTVLSDQAPLDPSNAVFHVQKIPPKADKDKQPPGGNASPGKSAFANIFGDSTEKGVKLRSIYQAGHSINNSGLCPDMGKQQQLMILVTSAPAHKAARMAIRQTWGSFGQRSDINVAFFVGTSLDEKVHKVIYDEQAMYGDMICANFVDTYNNLTLKTVSMLEWVDSYCSHAKFVMKTDDDMFINIPVLLRFIEKRSKHQKTIFGRLAKKWKPIRSKKSKYYVSPEQYKPAVFPNFTTGPAYLLTGDSVKQLYEASLNHTYLKLEDVFVTGIVAEEAKVYRIHANEFFNKRISFNPCNIQKGISIHMIKFHEQFDLWKKLLDGRSKCP